MNHTIRPFERQDGTAVTQLWNTCLPHDRIEQAWLLRLLDTPNYDPAGVLVAEVDGQIVGFVASVIRKVPLVGVGLAQDTGWILNFVVRTRIGMRKALA